MSLETTIKFLIEKPGYIKVSPKKISDILKEDEEICKEALHNVKQSLKGETLLAHKDMKIRRMWKYPGAKEWGISLENDNNVDLESIDKFILKALDKVELFKGDVKNINRNSSSELNIFLADQHIGAATIKGESQYDNKYDECEVNRRFANLFREIMFLNNNVSPIKKVRLLLLGDSLDGMDGFTTSRSHSLEQNMSNQEAFECFLTTHISFINSLISVFEKVEVHLTCNSNHGGDFEYTAHRALQLYYRNINGIDCTVYQKFLSHFETNSHCYIITHGKDKKNRKFGLPKHLDEKTEVLLQQYIVANKITKPIRVVKGDLHIDTFEEGKLMTYKNVPSFYGASGWVMDNYGTTEPKVAFELINGQFILQDNFKIK